MKQTTLLTSTKALRPRWTSLYAARKRQKNAAAILPELPNTFFGWIPTLYRITEEQVLASAGLDAYVFLGFFRMAVKFTAITFFLQLVIMFPVHYKHTGGVGLPNPGPAGNNSSSNETDSMNTYRPYTFASNYYPMAKDASGDEDQEVPPSETMLWLYLMFVYLFTSILLWLIVSETKKIIRVRQAYLGSQSTITDRTIRLSGIPEALRSDEMIKETIENLDIGKVESVLLCKDWRELDELVRKRHSVLRKLEEAWTVHLGPRKSKKIRSLVQGEGSAGENDGDGHEEDSRLLGGDSSAHNGATAEHNERPKTRIWHGFLSLQSRLIDAIDYYEEQLRKLDDSIETARNKVFKPTPLAFVTLDSTATSVCHHLLQFGKDTDTGCSKCACKLRWTPSP